MTVVSVCVEAFSPGLSLGRLCSQVDPFFSERDVFCFSIAVLGSNVNSVVAPGSYLGQWENVVGGYCTEPYSFLKRYKYSHIDGCLFYFFGF